MGKYWQIAGVAALASVAAVPAEATRFDFQMGDYSWSIDNDLAPYQNDADGVVYAGVESLQAGNAGPVFDIDFFSDANDGGLRLTDSVSGDLFAYSGPTLYSVANGTVRFGTGTFDLTSTSGNADAKLSITEAPAVPEPATWAMMVLGFGVAGAALRHRRKPAVSVRFA